MKKVKKTGIDIEIVKPAEIEKRSFEIISERLKNKNIDKINGDIIKRVIHTSADFDYEENLIFSEDAVNIAVNAVRSGASIVTDTKMVYSGINKNVLKKFGGDVYCFISDEDVAREAREREITRSMISMEKACRLEGDLIFAIGNAPTALIRLYELICQKEISPKIVIGVPVGFVNVVESKKLFINSDIPHIIAEGNKGGSNVAAAICNAVIYKADKR